MIEYFVDSSKVTNESQGLGVSAGYGEYVRQENSVISWNSQKLGRKVRQTLPTLLDADQPGGK